MRRFYKFFHALWFWPFVKARTGNQQAAKSGDCRKLAGRNILRAAKFYGQKNLRGEFLLRCFQKNQRRYFVRIPWGNPLYRGRDWDSSSRSTANMRFITGVKPSNAKFRAFGNLYRQNDIKKPAHINAPAF